jgi:hypothetical protein
VHPQHVELVRQRYAFWAQLARLRDWDISVHDITDLSACSDALVWIDLPLLSRDAYRSLHTRAVAANALSVLDLPDQVDIALGLDLSFPLLARAGLPVPRTALVPIDDATASCIDSPGAVRRLRTERMYEAMFDACVDPHRGVYVRGFSSSVKSSNPEHFFGDNQTDIEATSFEVIRHLRDALELGGLALREHLDLERIEIGPPGERGSARVPFEIRITVLNRRPFLASYHGPFDTLVDSAHDALTAELTARSPRVEAALRDVLPTLLAAGLPDNYVADLAFTADGAPVVLELNPLYAAGYNVRAAHALVVTALAADLAEGAGYPGLRDDEVLASAEEISGEPIYLRPPIWLPR